MILNRTYRIYVYVWFGIEDNKTKTLSPVKSILQVEIDDMIFLQRFFFFFEDYFGRIYIRLS